jgi:hypothetical protein
LAPVRNCNQATTRKLRSRKWKTNALGRIGRETLELLLGVSEVELAAVNGIGSHPGKDGKE